MRSIITGLVAVLVLASAATPAKGQVAWDSPLLMPPGAAGGWGVYLVDPAPDSGIGALMTWRGPGPVGFRVGLAEGWRGELAVYGGVDIAGHITRHSANFPLDVDWVTGAGLGIGEATLLSFPLGLSLGRQLNADGVLIHPYVTPRIVLDAWMGSERPRRGTDLNLAVDLGLDIAFQPEWAIRFGGTFGDRNALAIGLGFSGF